MSPLATVSFDNKVYIRGKALSNTLIRNEDDQFYFVLSGSASVAGNIMALLDYENISTVTLAARAFKGLFYSCSITDASNLILPATSLTSFCYENMFRSCTSLTSAPLLPATTVSKGAYVNMFNGCNSLSSVTCLATSIQNYDNEGDEISSVCNWLKSVAASGTFTKASSMSSWPAGNSGIPTGWSIENYSE